MMTVGFLVGTGTLPTNIGTTYDATKPVILNAGSTAATTVDNTANNLMPVGAYIDHLTVVVTPTVAASLTLKLTWDAAGDVPASAPATVTLEPCVTTTTNSYIVTPFQGWIKPPSTATSLSRLYLWIKTNAGTVNVVSARLDWTEAFAGGPR